MNIIDQGNTTSGTETIIDCPVCGKKNISLQSCPRCSTDLSVLRRITEHSVSLARQAYNAVQRMDSQRAIELAEKSWEMKNNQLAAKAACIAFCAEHDFEEGIKWYRMFVNIQKRIQ